MAKHKIDSDYRMDDTKLLWHMDRVRDLFDNDKRMAPIMIDMGLTKFCNIKCIYCYGQNQNPCKDLIKREPLIELVSSAKRLGIKAIGFIGDGEPTCNPAMYEALEKATCDMSISTNGVMITSHFQREVILKNCTWMRFNLSAGTKEGYKKIHGADHFERVVTNIKEMLRLRNEEGHKCGIGLQSVYVPGLMDEEMIAESKLAVELGVDYFVIKQCSLPDGNKRVGEIEFDVNDYDSSRVKEVLETCEALSTEKTKIIPKWNLIKQKGKRPYNGCPGIPLLLQISGNGDVYPCGQMFQNKKYDKYLIGNIHEDSFEKLLNSDKYWDVMKEMQKFDVHNDCTGACRQDKINEFCYNYLNKPRGINFI